MSVLINYYNLIKILKKYNDDQLQKANYKKILIEIKHNYINKS
jgi:hypothetical protein